MVRYHPNHEAVELVLVASCYSSTVTTCRLGQKAPRTNTHFTLIFSELRWLLKTMTSVSKKQWLKLITMALLFRIKFITNWLEKHQHDQCLQQVQHASLVAYSWTKRRRLCRKWATRVSNLLFLHRRLKLENKYKLISAICALMSHSLFYFVLKLGSVLTGPNFSITSPLATLLRFRCHTLLVCSLA